MKLTEAAQNLVTWVHSPTCMDDYTQYADALTLEDCLALMQFEDKTVARVAWLEYGQRQELVSFDLRLISTPTGSSLDVSLDPLRVAHTPVLREVEH